VSEQKYWLGFSLVPGIGPRRLTRLRDYFGDLASAWHAPELEIRRSGLDDTTSARFLQRRGQIDLDGEFTKVKQAGVQLIALDDIQYPALLRTIPDPPILLFVRGQLLPEDNNALSVVGTRRATHYGKDAAYKLSAALAQQGVTIVSGLAQGIDTAAHQGAIQAGGRTLAVLGSGVDVIYPSENRALAQDIVRNGALISEFPLGSPPDSRNFPRRNRIISGLALGVLIVEAPVSSGALITANMAAEQGREVFAIPGNIFSAASRGPNQLIQEGAKLVMGVDDILDELQLAFTRIETSTQVETMSPANETESRILKHLSADPLHIDELARISKLPVAQLTSTLTILELKGLAQKVGPMQYCLSNTR
jgi:DNA processing protein